MWELSLEPRCIAFGRQPQAALVPGFLVTRSDICASPLPAGLPTSCCSSLRSKARSSNTFCSGLLWKARSDGPVTDTVEMKHSCFIFQLYPDSTWDWIQTGLIVFWQYDTSSHFKLMLSPTLWLLCDTPLRSPPKGIVYLSFVGLFFCWLLLNLYPTWSISRKTALSRIQGCPQEGI